MVEIEKQKTLAKVCVCVLGLSELSIPKIISKLLKINFVLLDIAR